MTTRLSAAFLAITIALTEVVVASEKNETVSPAGKHERVTAEVLKVFSATDSGSNFRAYVINWKGQEVIVSDVLVATDYKVGDKVSVLAMNIPFPKDSAKPGLLSFVIIPESRR